MGTCSQIQKKLGLLRQLRQVRERWLEMENSSLSTDVWNNFTTSSSKDVDDTPNVLLVRDLSIKVINVIIGTVGVLDNLFVIIILIFFTKIADKVIIANMYTLCLLSIMK